MIIGVAFGPFPVRHQILNNLQPKMKAIPKKSFLLKQNVEEDKDGKKVYKDVVATRGVPIEVTNEEYKKFGSAYFDIEATDDLNGGKTTKKKSNL